MWAAFWNALRIVGVGTLLLDIEKRLRSWFGFDESTNSSPVKPYMFLLGAGLIVYFIYKFVLGKKVIIK
jgi:hypothetical protein